MKENSQLSRRSFLKSALATITVGATTPCLLRATSQIEKSLQIYNTHTGEWFKGVYAVGQHYVPEALQDLQKLFRDWRMDAQYPINPRLYDMMYRLGRTFDTSRPFDLICGYRSPKTNTTLRHHNHGVAKKSRHLSGQAVDFSLNGVKLIDLRNATRSLKVGGVGYYPASGFVHMDIREKIAWW